jgi:hypothetical protein
MLLATYFGGNQTTVIPSAVEEAHAFAVRYAFDGITRPAKIWGSLYVGNRL